MVVLPFLSNFCHQISLQSWPLVLCSWRASVVAVACCGRGDPRLTILVSRSLVASTSLVVATPPSVALRFSGRRFLQLGAIGPSTRPLT
jgi:hypothetical protein